MWNALRKILLGKEYLFTLKEEKPFRIIDFSNKEILIQTTENKLRKISRNEIEDSYNYLIKNGKISRVKIQELFSPYNPAYVASILSCNEDITFRINPTIELIYKKSLFAFHLKDESLNVNEDKYDKRNFNKNGINKITGTKYDKYGYDTNWCDKNGFKWDGKHIETNTYFNPNGYDREGYDKNGFNNEGNNLITGKNKDIFGKQKHEYENIQNNDKITSKETRIMLDKLTSVYKILYKILLLPESDWKTKIYANAALSYFINPWDVIPEAEKGVEGYLDDFYICLEILRDLKKYRPTLISKISPKYIKEDLDLFLEENIKYCKRELKDKIFDIKELVGYDSLEFFDLGNDQFTNKISYQMYNRAKLIGVISYLYDEISNNTNSLEAHKYLNDLSLSEEFFDIMRITNKFYKKQEFFSLYNRDELEQIFTNYEDKLKNIKNTKYGPIVNKSLPIFKTLCNILKDKECTWEIKHEINSVLSYFALIEDIIDDSIDSGIGYIDDLFIGSFVLFDISERNRILVKNNLTEDIKFEEIYPILDNTMNILEVSTIQHASGKIINLLGLKGLLSFYDLSATDKLFTIANRALDNKIKTIFIDLVKLYLEDNSIIEDFSYDTESIIDYLLNNESPTKIQKLNLFIEIAINISYNKNIEKEIEEKEELEAKAIMLKYRILSE